MKILQKSIILVTFCCAISTTVAQDIKQKLELNFTKFKTLPALKHGIASLHVMDSESGETIFEDNSQIGLPTASTLKVITAVTALDILGPDYKYTTTLDYTGQIDDNGILHGDLIIRGSGDPTLGSERYEQSKSSVLLNRWTDAVSKAGIKAIQGRVIGDDLRYNGHDIPGGWIWTDIGNYYGAGISALNWQENKAGVQFTPTATGQIAPIKEINTNLGYLNFINQVKTGSRGSGDNVYAYSAPYSEKIYLRGTYGVDLKKTIEISLPDPAYEAAHQLRLALEQRGIPVGNETTTTQRLIEQEQHILSKSTILDSYNSPRLADIVYWFNQKSINLYGEAMLKSIGYTLNNTTTTQAASSQLKKYWLDKLGINTAELDIVDGSGLSPQNNITTSAMSRIMQYAKNKPWYTEFNKSLPIYNQMTMKSGTINGTLGYTGYHESKSGQKYTFSVLVYNYATSATNMRQHLFELLNTLK